MNIDGLTMIGIGVVLFVIAAAAFFAFGWRTRKQVEKCRHEVTSDIRWTEEGWVSVCLVCRDWLYHGDDQYPTVPK